MSLIASGAVVTVPLFTGGLNRSRVAQAILSDDPARTYLNLAGGMAAWQSHGLPIVRHD